MGENQLRYHKLTEDEIVGFFRDSFSADCTKDQLIGADRNFLANIYTWFLYDFGVTNHGQTDLNACFGIRDIESCEAVIPLVNLSKTIQAILAQIGVHDFSLSDILLPKRKRNILIFSQLIGLWSRYMEIRTQFNSMKEKFQDIPVRRINVEARLSEVKRLVSEKNVELAKLKDEMAPQQEELQEAAIIYEQKKEEGKELKAYDSELKIRKAECKEKKSSIDVQISNIKQDIINLESEVVENPEIIISKTEMKAKMREDIGIERRKLEREFNSAVCENDMYVNALNKMRITMQTIEEVQDCGVTLKGACSDIEQLTDEINLKKKKVEELKAINRKHEELSEDTKKDIHKQQMEFQNKVSLIKKMNKELKIDVEKKNEGIKNRSKEEEILFMQRKGLMEEIEDMKKQHHLFKEEIKLKKELIKANLKKVLESSNNILDST